MKKTYMRPTAQVTEIELQQMIAESVGLGGSYQGGKIESRGSNDMWDEEEDY